MKESLPKHPVPSAKCGMCATARILCVMLTAAVMVSAASAQDRRIDIRLENASLVGAIKQISSATGLEFFYNAGELSAVEKEITGHFRNQTVGSILDDILSGTPFTHKMENGTIVIVRRPHELPAAQQDNVVLTGVVVDGATGSPLAGATVAVEGTPNGTITDQSGRYSIPIASHGGTVVFSYVGYQNEPVKFTGDNRKDFERIALQEAELEIDEVVITGIYERKKESFTGSSQTYSVEELKTVGAQNLIQSLKTLDPAFAIIENNQYGSDPNRTPDIEIRGKSSIVGFKEQFGEDPNQPLFILDGFETTLAAVMDLSLDRIASVTILKDAASTAIYGAKAANGVVVVETQVPKQGKLRLSYNGSFDISFADLTQYNLMNAEEKLRFELLAGNFKSNLPASVEKNMIRYNGLLKNVLEGVDTYWMSEPLRTALNQRHNVYVEGGDNRMRYGVSLSYNNTQGIMKNSRRQVLSGSVDLVYRTEKLSFSNKLTVDNTTTNDPVVAFSEYSRANPYYRKYNENGGIDKWLESNGDFEGAGVNVSNPLWNDHLNSYDRGNSWGVRENFNMEYRPFSFLWIRGRIGLNKTTSESEDFRSPEDTAYDGADLLKKGSYSNSRSDSFSYDGDLTITYGQLLSDAHQINAVIGASMRESTSDSKSFSAIGFPDGDFTTPAFSNQYPEADKPGYNDYKKRNASFFFNGGYSYKNRYLLDANLRADGSSVFGSNRLFTTTWAVGVGWNLHNEKFIADHTDLFSLLKIRASIGNPGNQNFGSFNAVTTYKFNNWLLNNFGAGILVDAFGDPDLEWQKTMDKNVGLDVSMLDNRLNITFDWYHKRSDQLMAYIGVPLSVGTSGRLTNIGTQIDKGYNGTVRFSPIYRPKERINWTVSLNFRHGTAYYKNIEDSLAKLNQQNRSKNLTRYYDGGSPTALWTVVSEGIDPATGKEIFLTPEGRRVFSYDSDNEVEVGDTRPTVEGVFGNTLYWKGFSCSINIRYSYGADAFNQTLYDKVENISYADLSSNQDRRALYDRWIKPGDKARFKGISLTDQTRISSRFVQKNNFISIESVRVGYEFTQSWLKKVGLKGMTISGYMNDIYRFATIRAERGIDYPFARSFTLALSLNF